VFLEKKLPFSDFLGAVADQGVDMWPPILTQCVIEHFLCSGESLINNFVPQKNNFTVVTRYYILRLECTKFDFCRSSASDLTGGSFAALPKPLSWI